MFFVDILFFGSLAVVLFTLIMGMVQMAKGTAEGTRKSNVWMWRRVYAQGAAIVILILAAYLKNKGLN